MGRRRAKHLDFVILDLAVLEIAYCVSCYIRHGFFSGEVLEIYYKLWLLLLLIHIGVGFLFESYQDILTRGYLKELESVCKHMLIVHGILITCLFTMQVSSIYSRQIIMTTMFFGILFIYLERIAWKHYLSNRYGKVEHSRTILLVTDTKEVENLLHYLKLDQASIKNYQIVGMSIVDEVLTGKQFDGIEVKAGLSDLMEYAKGNVIDEVILDISCDSKLQLKLAQQFLELGITVHIYMGRIYEELPNRSMEKIGQLNVLTSCSSVVSDRQLVLKRLMDIVGGIIGLILACVIGVVIGPLIYIKSPGPILFSQIRVGKNGRKFRMYKFRSMYPDAEERKKELGEQNEMKGQMFKIENDPRIIKGIGTFIRKTSLDEFPQFFNVLIGEMSLVGTRPPTVDEYERYELHHKKRISIRPGITGLWQISGRNDITSFEEVVSLDSQYIDHFNLELDIKILVNTIQQVLIGNGAK